VIEASREQRAVFVALALRANQVVSRDAVIDAVWGESPPAGAGNSLYSYISRLRRVLELDGARAVLISEGDGYSLRLDPGALDVHQFDHFRQIAQECWNRRDIHGTRAALDSALALWQGEALTGVDSPLATLHRKRLGELRLAALERRAEARIVSSDAGAVPELYRLAAAHPLRETLIGLLMTALGRDGRIAEAVEVFEQTRQLLVDQLGIEPGTALRRVYDEIVAGTTAAPVRADVPRVGPRPPDVLVGRVSELATLRSRLTDVRRGRGGTVWVEGGPGSGKSGLLAAAFGDADRPEVGCKLLWAAGDEVGRRLPLGLMLTCLGINESSADHRAAELAQAMRGPTTELYPWRPTDPELVAVDRLANYVDQLTAAGPVVLVLDDLQWADDASLLVWHRLTKITRQSPLLLVGAIRSLPRRPETERLRAAVAAGHGNVVRLKALDAAAAGELTGRLLGAQPGPGLLNAIDSAAGNPLFLREIVEALVRDGVVKVSDGVAEVGDQLDDPCQPTVRSAVDKRLALLADTTREALRWAAVLGSEFDLGDLATVMACSVTELIPAVEEASANGVLVEAGQWYAFRHSMLRRAVYVSMPVNVRVALHRQAAEMLHAAGAHGSRDDQRQEPGCGDAPDARVLRLRPGEQ
jgi:DNA-binding SARP family transcriptional activator